MIKLTEEEFNNLFKKYKQVRKADNGTPLCIYCGNPFSQENLRYHNDSTEVGTPNCTIEITCDVCHKVIWRGGSWYTGIDNNDDLIYVIEEAMENEKR